MSSFTKVKDAWHKIIPSAKEHDTIKFQITGSQQHAWREWRHFISYNLPHTSSLFTLFICLSKYIYFTSLLTPCDIIRRNTILTIATSENLVSSNFILQYSWNKQLKNITSNKWHCQKETIINWSFKYHQTRFGNIQGVFYTIKK